ncbi:hypothetical protein LCGC14_1360070, partial [marine sediment metagenome]
GKTIYKYLKIHNIKREKLYMNKGWLIHMYIELELSPYEIGEICRVGHVTIHRCLRKFNIPIRSHSEAAKISHNRPEIKKKISDGQKRVWSDLDYRESHIGENHPMYGRCGELHPNWKENYEDLSYEIKHRRIHLMLEEMSIFAPEYCPYCNKPKGKRKLDLMNLFHTYLENSLDYYYMCQKCHKIYHSLAGLEKRNSKVKSIPNLIKDLLKLKTRVEREQLLKKVILKCK